MTTGDTARLYPAADPPGADEPAEVLRHLKDTALEMLARMDSTPASLRIRTADVELELEWSQRAPAGPAGLPPAPAPAILAPAAEASANGYLTAPMVGVFYRAPRPGADPFVGPGDEITPGQQVGIIEAMKLMVPVEATVAGRVVEVLVEDAAAVEYGDRLFSIEPAGS
jgi:acetyl-CoA carboxylase biotin carboxyl carrier protein